MLEVFAAVKIHVMVFGVVAQCSDLVKMEAAWSSKIFIHITTLHHNPEDHVLKVTVVFYLLFVSLFSPSSS